MDDVTVPISSEVCDACGDKLPAGAPRATIELGAGAPDVLRACTPLHLADLMLGLSSDILRGERT